MRDTNYKLLLIPPAIFLVLAILTGIYRLIEYLIKAAL